MRTGFSSPRQRRGFPRLHPRSLPLTQARVPGSGGRLPGRGPRTSRDRLETQPSLDVLSLGTEGEIVLGFGARVIVDGPGPDFTIHENPFWPGGSEENVFAEFGEVAVSVDGDEWWTYPCLPTSGQPETYEGCAGWNPTRTFSVTEGFLLTLEQTGGDGFDLAESGLEAVRYVRIRDLSEGGPAPSAGFDLDAVTLLNWDHDETLFPAE